MAFSVNTPVGDGVTKQFAVNFTNGIFSRDNVHVFVEGEVDGAGDPIERTFTWINDGLIELDGDAPASGLVIEIRRIMDKDEPAVDFADGEILTEETMDRSVDHLLNSIHELLDGYGFSSIQTDINMNGNRVVGLGAPQNPDDAARVSDIAESASAAVLRQELGSSDDGSNLVAHAGTSQTVTESLNQRVIYVGSVAELEARTPIVGQAVEITASGGAGLFVFRSGDQSANVTNDPEKGVWIAPSSDATGSSGAWMRRYDGVTTGSFLQGEWFGAVGDGVFDNTTAFSATIDYAQFKGTTAVSFGRGDFLLSSPVSKALTSNLSLRGVGRGITRFMIPVAGGITFTSSNQAVQCDTADFDVVATGVTGLAALDFQWPAQAGLVTTQIKVKSVDVYGADNSSYFDIGLKFLNCSNVTINDCLINGQGGNPATIAATSGIFINNGYDYFISDCRFHFWDKGIHLYDYVEGINIDDIKVEYTDYGVFKERVGAIGVAEGLQLNVTDSHLTCRRRGVVVNEHKAYFLSNLHIQCRDDAATPIEPASPNGLTDFAAIEVQGAQTTPDNEADVAVIENISFRGSTTNNDKSVLYGIVVQDAKDLIIRDCPALSNLAIGINLQSGTTNVNVRNIVNRDCTDDIVDDGAGNNVLLREYSRTFTTTLTGGAAQESVDVPVPSGVLNDKPEVAILQHGGGTNFLVASYDFDSASSTATNIRFNVQRNDSANITGASERFSLYAAETT